MRHYELELFYALHNTHLPFSKYKVQMRHYLLILFYSLENIPFFPNTKVKPDIIYWCY